MSNTIFELAIESDLDETDFASRDPQNSSATLVLTVKKSTVLPTGTKSKGKGSTLQEAIDNALDNLGIPISPYTVKLFGMEFPRTN